MITPGGAFLSSLTSVAVLVMVAEIDDESPLCRYFNPDRLPSGPSRDTPDPTTEICLALGGR
jgi:hypothetical protein